MFKQNTEKKDHELEKIELLMEQKINQIQNNNDDDYYFNDKDELNSFFLFNSFLDKYIEQISGKDEFIIIKNENNEEKIEKNNYSKIIQYIIDGKIIIRDKKFIDLLNILKIFKHNEELRINFIKKIKNLNVHKILEKIDKEYIEIYNNKYKSTKLNESLTFDINLDKLGFPHLNSYPYLMTFERKRCSLSIEDNNLFLYYHYNNKEYKFILFIDTPPTNYSVSIDLNKKKIIFPIENLIGPNYLFIDEAVCLNFCTYPFYFTYSYFENIISSFNDTTTNNTKKFKEYKKVSVDLEKRYCENIFKYHNVDFFYELSKKYVNYKFDIFYNYVKKNNINEQDKNYLSLYIY